MQACPQSDFLNYSIGSSVRLLSPSKDFTACVFSNRVLVPKSIDDWVLVYPQKDETSVRAFFTVFQREATRIGMNVSVPSKD